jgi:uncharacterized protein (TIGR02268 family)
LFLALALLWAAVARGDADLSRAKRDRAVTVAGTPADPLPEIHVAPDVPTLLWFPADIQRNTLTVDESRIRVLDTGARSIIVQAAADYRAGERHDLTVFFADGAAPARAGFVLVMDPAEVDIRIDVTRPELRAACPAEVPPADPLPEDFVLLRYVNERGVQTGVVEPVADKGQGLSTNPGVSYRGNGWVLFDIVISNGAGQPPFSPRDATLTGKGGVTLRARRVKAERDAIVPGEFARVLVVAEEPLPSAGRVFTLEVLGDSDRRLVLPRVAVPVAVPEGRR